MIAAGIAQAAFAAKSPEGMWASGPSIRSANTDSMIACWRCVMSASVTGSVLLVVPPHREQLVGVVAVAYPPDDEPGGDLVFRAGERGVVDLGDLGVGDQLAGVGVEDGAGVAHRGPRVVGGVRSDSVSATCTLLKVTADSCW